MWNNVWIGILVVFFSVLLAIGVSLLIYRAGRMVEADRWRSKAKRPFSPVEYQGFFYYVVPEVDWIWSCGKNKGRMIRIGNLREVLIRIHDGRDHKKHILNASQMSEMAGVALNFDTDGPPRFDDETINKKKVEGSLVG